MKNIILTENQLDTVVKSITETINDNTYSNEVTVEVDSFRTAFKGQKIEEVTVNYMIRLTYLIEQEHRSWGIKNTSLYDIKGPEKVQAEVTVYNEELDDTKTESINLSLNWENIKIEIQDGEGFVTTDKMVTLVLTNDESGNLVVKHIELIVYT